MLKFKNINLFNILLIKLNKILHTFVLLFNLKKYKR